MFHAEAASIVKTITPRRLERPDALLHEAKVHQVSLGTEG